MAISKRKVKKSPISPVALEKQMLNDLEKRISLNVGSFLVLTEEGDPTQIALAHQKAKSELIKFGPEMHKIAQKIGGALPQMVEEYLHSIDSILYSSAGWIDEDQISQCFHTTQRLETELTLKQNDFWVSD